MIARDFNITKQEEVNLHDNDLPRLIKWYFQVHTQYGSIQATSCLSQVISKLFQGDGMLL